jgi:hypothetical protein
MNKNAEECVRATTQEWFNRTVTEQPQYGTSLEELLRYTTAVANAIDRNELQVPYLTPRCPECGMHIRDMTEDVKHWHLIIGDYVIVACEWYWVVNPNTVGINEEWFQWWGDEDEGTKPGPEVRNWIETGRW